MTHPFLRKLAAAWNPQEWRDVTVITCLSSGADSVALLRGLAALRGNGPGRIVVAHFNHGLRGNDSDGDEAFARTLCDSLELPLEVGKTATLRTTPPGDDVATTSEAAARTARYAYFQEVAKAQGARFVTTAHTADDQVETILHRIIRGTGIGGLGGIPRTRLLDTGITMLRPLLCITRDEVLDFLNSLSQPFREDASNHDPCFTRNRIRAELLPELARNYNPRVRQSLLQLGSLAGDSQHVVEALCADVLDRCVMTRDALRIELACQPLANLPLAAHREILVTLWKDADWPQQEMNFQHWTQLASMLQDPPAMTQHTLPGKILASRQAKTLILTRV